MLGPRTSRNRNISTAIPSMVSLRGGIAPRRVELHAAGVLRAGGDVGPVEQE